ncbi:MAG: hypothetical protein ACXV5J_13155, partial [Candidatus Angelobacter sp.]
MNRSRLQFRFLLAFLALSTIATVLWAIAIHSGGGLSEIAAQAKQPDFHPSSWEHPWLLSLRVAAILALCGYAFLRRSLTVWIFAGMLVGVELGQDLGQSAANLQVLSSIFLK